MYRQGTHFAQAFCRLAQRAGGVNHVVDDDTVLALDLTHNVHALDLARLDAVLDRNRQSNVGHLRICAGGWGGGGEG